MEARAGAIGGQPAVNITPQLRWAALPDEEFNAICHQLCVENSAAANRIIHGLVSELGLNVEQLYAERVLSMEQEPQETMGDLVTSGRCYWQPTIEPTFFIKLNVTFNPRRDSEKPRIGCTAATMMQELFQTIVHPSIDGGVSAAYDSTDNKTLRIIHAGQVVAEYHDRAVHECDPSETMQEFGERLMGPLPKSTDWEEDWVLILV